MNEDVKARLRAKAAAMRAEAEAKQRESAPDETPPVQDTPAQAAQTPEPAAHAAVFVSDDAHQDVPTQVSEPVLEEPSDGQAKSDAQENREKPPHIRPSIIAAHIPALYKKGAKIVECESAPPVQDGESQKHMTPDSRPDKGAGQDDDKDINKALNFALVSIFAGIVALLFSFCNPMGMSGVLIVLVLSIAGLVFALIAKMYGLTKGFVFVTFSCNTLGFLIACCLLLMQLQVDPISNLAQMMG